MQTKLLIIISALVLIPIQLVYAPPSPNEWPDAPYCPGGCTLDYLKEKWAQYYDYKGSEWMEHNKQEMLDAMKNGTFDEWIHKDPAHDNVRMYYLIKGEIPDTDGKYIDQIYAEQEWQYLEQQIGHGYLPIGEYTLSLNFVIIAILFVGVGLLIWISWKRK
jgi:hypothetical protein